MTKPTSTQQAIERWFRQRGLPLFIDGYDARTQVWTRAKPFLAVAFVALALPLSADTVAAAAKALAISAAVVLAGWAAGNLIDRRAPFARPTSVGFVELGAFVVGVGLPHVVDGDTEGAVYAAVSAGVVLAVTYVVVSYGVIPLLIWVVRRLTRSLPQVRNAAVRALPMLLIFIALLLYTTEIWQAMATLRGVPFVTTLVLFAVVALVFVSGRLRADSTGVEQFDSWPAVHEAAAGTPACTLAGDGDGTPTPHQLTQRQRRNVLLLLMSSQVIMALTVAVTMGVFYLLLGFLTIDEPLVTAWIGGAPRVWLHLGIGDRQLILSEEHVRVAGFLASFSGFYFAVYSVTDPTIREGLNDDSTSQLRTACAARQLYLDARQGATAPQA